MLNYPRQNACICVYNNRYMYIFRGKEKNVLLETIEFLDLNNIKNEWNVFHPLEPEDKTIFRTKDLKIQAKFRNYCTVYLGKVYAFDLKNGIANKENGFHSFDIKNNCWFFEIN